MFILFPHAQINKLLLIYSFKSVCRSRSCTSRTARDQHGVQSGIIQRWAGEPLWTGWDTVRLRTEVEQHRTLLHWLRAERTTKISNHLCHFKKDILHYKGRYVLQKWKCQGHTAIVKAAQLWVGCSPKWSHTDQNITPVMVSFPHLDR